MALSLLAPARDAAAADNDASVREASKHFQQGVVLYGEADYRSALVEFKRAAALAPSSTVTYNIAETQFQLKDYAGALKSFERYLAASGPNDPHRPEVESNLRLLNGRVGRVSVTTVPVGADVSIDDEAQGRTPFADPLIVNVGRVRLVATLAGRAPVARAIDVAAEDNLAVTVELGPALSEEQRAALPLTIPTGGASSSVPMVEMPAPPPTPKRSILRPAGWIIAGAAAAGSVTFGLLALKESRDLRSARDTFPTRSQHLTDLSDRTRTYAIIADGLAATAVIMAVWTWFSPTGREATSPPATSVSLAPNAALFQTSF